MYISKFRLTGYSSFQDSGWITLLPKINIFLGQNNVGKSALLKALVFPLDDFRHRNEREFRQQFLPMPSIDLDVVTDGIELTTRIIQSESSINLAVRGPSVADLAAVDTFLSAPDLILKLRRVAGQSTVKREKLHPAFGDESEFTVGVSGVAGALRKSGPQTGNAENIGQITDLEQFQFMFYFGPQRINIAKYQGAAERRLAFDARNLPAVLAFLQGSRPDVFKSLCEDVRSIVPSVASLSVVMNGGELEIITWPAIRDHEELGFSLAHSGTGVSQIIAIIAAAMLSEQSVIIIDEIGSFLNPMAIKSLLRLLTLKYAKHQYIISAHSTEVVTSVDPQTIYLVTKTTFESEIRGIDRGNADDLRDISESVGVSMMDVFGAEYLCWVEGPSEESCFPMIFELPSTVKFAALRTPDVVSNNRGRRAALVSLFARITSTVAPLVKGMSFTIDQDNLSVQAITELEASPGANIFVLPRRNLECFFLDPLAISEVLSAELHEVIQVNQIVETMESLAGEECFKAKAQWKGALDGDVWLTAVDGAKLLTAIFSVASGNRLEFRKVRHDPMLVSSILKHKPRSLTLLSTFIKKVVNAACAA